jgi:hypothetical protein
VRFLNQLAAATGVEILDNVDPLKLGELFVGKEVTLTVAHKTRDGVAQLIVHKVSAPKAE